MAASTGESASARSPRLGLFDQARLISAQAQKRKRHRTRPLPGRSRLRSRKAFCATSCGWRFPPIAGTNGWTGFRILIGAGGPANWTFGRMWN